MLRRITTRREEGQTLVVALVLLILISSLVFGSLTTARERILEIRHTQNRYDAELAARSAVERQIARLDLIKEQSAIGSPWALVDALDSNTASGPGGYTQALADQTFTDLEGNTVGQYDIYIDVVPQSSSRRIVTITAHSYVPTKAAYAAGQRDSSRYDSSSVVEIAYRGSEVFDYAYFINHWGWFFGDTISSNGNVRSNGIFDFGGYASTINGSPRYTSSNGAELQGYIDDNHDGVLDGSDGGVYAGMGIVNQQNVRGMGADSANQHIVPDPIVMPNLSDLSLYESKAIAKGSSISIGGVTLVDGVLGDDPSEKQHLYLVGTDANPIVLDGAVVVRGSVIVSGKVTGQGSIYAGGNIYLPKNVEYVNGPDSARPASNDQNAVESWRENSMPRDSLGLFAREHVVVGDYTHSWWQYYVGQWINDSHNQSAEDAGIDGIHNTREGFDGVLGTADDDVLEGDSAWTVSYYTAADASQGLIPPGFSVGDVIPGSGEDIDGDGQHDGTTQLSEFNIPAPLSPTNWQGLATTLSSYSAVSTIYLNRLDAALYTNHTLGALMINWGGLIDINGSIVSRNESIIYGANGINMNHDERLTGRGSFESGFETPITWDPVRVLHEDQETRLPSGISHSPVSIAQHYTGGAASP
jgi:hypothetical protein